MGENVAKYILGFLAIVYVASGVAEIAMVKNGVDAVFESVKTFVPHLAMFVLGFYFSRK